MLPGNDPDRIQIIFDNHRLVANAGLILPTTLPRHFGLPQLVQQRLDLGNAPGLARSPSLTHHLIPGVNASAHRFGGFGLRKRAPR